MPKAFQFFDGKQ